MTPVSAANTPPIGIRQILMPRNEVVSNYSIWALQRSLAAHGMVDLGPHSLGIPIIFLRALGKLHFLRNFVHLGRSACFAQCHRMTQSHLFPVCFWREIVVYAFDCWPPDYDRWERFFRRFRVKVALLTSRQSAAEMARRLPQLTSIWVPEATDAEEYRCGMPLRARSLDVLELGRKFDRYHGAIVGELRAMGRSHQFELTKGKVVFPSFRELVDGLADAKISVCFPASISHPNYAGHVETATHRYFESLASRCLMIGHAPKELVDLFGFNPVIEADLNDPSNQIREILENIESYQEQVDRNYERFLQVGTWNARAKTIIETLGRLGYAL